MSKRYRSKAPMILAGVVSIIMLFLLLSGAIICGYSNAIIQSGGFDPYALYVTCILLGAVGFIISISCLIVSIVIYFN